MKFEVKLLRAVEVPTQELIWALFDDQSVPVQRVELEQAIVKKFGPRAKGIHFFWNFNHTKKILENQQTTVGVEIFTRNFDGKAQSTLAELEENLFDSDEVLRREGALLSELERIGIYLMGNENPFIWKLHYSGIGN